MSRREDFSVGQLRIGSAGTPYKLVQEFAVSITPTVLVANTVSPQDFTFTGVKAGDHVVALTPPAAFASVATVATAHVKADNTVTIKFLSAATTAPTAGTWTVVVERKGA